MVVLEGHNMLGVNSPNQYLQPDYLSPLPTTLDAKKSPLALLVQTCSQIGADTPSKSILHPSPLSSSDSNSSLSSNSSGAGQKRKASTSSDSGHGASLKSLSSDSNDSGRPRSSGSTSSTCSSAKQPRLSHSSSPSGHLMVNGKVSPTNKYSSANHHNNNNESSSVISHSAKLRKLSGQSISSECSEKGRPSGNVPSRSSPPSSHSASVIVPQGKTSAGSRSPQSSQPQEKTSKSSSEHNSSSSSSSSKNNTTSPKPSHHDQGASPIIRSGLDVLQGKDLPKFGAFGAYPPGFDPTNPAFRLPFLAAHHAHLLGYPHGTPGAVPPPGSPYASLYARSALKPGDSMMPVCKDPYCTGCQFGGPGAASASNAFMAAAAAAAASAAGSGAGPSVCPAGCAQCDHQKFPLIPPSAAAGGPTSGPYSSIPGFPPGLSHSALSALGAAYPPSLLSHPHHAAAAAAMMQHQQAAAAVAVAAAAQQQNAQRPYVCNWNSDTYCGKRFASSEELLQHLRTHTNSSAAASASSATTSAEGPSPSSAAFSAHPGLPPPSSSASLFSSALLNSSAMAAAAMHRNYPTPPLSPHSAARYNPYAVAAAAAAAASSGKAPGPLGPIPPPPPALAGYYASPYSLYGPRIG